MWCATKASRFIDQDVDRIKYRPYWRWYHKWISCLVIYERIKWRKCLIWRAFALSRKWVLSLGRFHRDEDKNSTHAYLPGPLYRFDLPGISEHQISKIVALFFRFHVAFSRFLETSNFFNRIIFEIIFLKRLKM